MFPRLDGTAIPRKRASQQFTRQADTAAEITATAIIEDR